MLFLTPVYRVAYGALNNTTVAFLLCYVLTMVFAIGLADLTYRFIEAPGVRYGKVVYQRMADWLGQPLQQGRLGNK